MKKITLFIICTLIGTAVFAQNVKPYVVDLSRIPAANDNRTVTFDKATKIVAFKKQDSNIYIWLNELDISNYNIFRIKYKALGDKGFIFVPDYGDDSIGYFDSAIYCPSYINEMVIPLRSGQKKLNGIMLAAPWNCPYEKFAIESIVLENVDNPDLTDIHASSEPPVIDTQSSGKINAAINAWDFVKNLGVGLQYQIFLPNTGELDFGMDYDFWHEIKLTKKIIQAIKAKGFNAIRLQTNPGSHILDENYTIDPRYIKAIKESVDWCIEEGMYVILCGPGNENMNNEFYKKRVENDIHYAGYIVNEKYKKESEKFLKAVWRQYAEAFNNSYDEHMIFETLNEPLDSYHEHCFYEKTDCVVCKKDFAVMNEYNQLILDTIRSTGGNNLNRFVMVAGLASGWKNITNSMFKMPKDKVKNKLIPVVHIYPMGTPPWHKELYTDGIKTETKKAFENMDKYYFKKKIPVYVSEVGHSPISNIMERINSIRDFMAEVTKDSRSCAVSMMCNMSWDFNYFDATNLEWHDTEYVDTILYSAQGKEYPLSTDFIKENEVKVESIVGKNLLNEPYELKDWNAYQIKSTTFYRSTPEKYRLVIELEKSGSEPILELAYHDLDLTWHNSNNTASLKNLKVKGGTFDGNIKVKDNTVEITINEKLAKELANCENVYINGKDILLKSVMVME